MAVIKKRRAIGIVAALAVLSIEGAIFAPAAWADPAFTIPSLDVALAGSSDRYCDDQHHRAVGRID